MSRQKKESRVLSGRKGIGTGQVPLRLCEDGYAIPRPLASKNLKFNFSLPSNLGSHKNSALCIHHSTFAAGVNLEGGVEYGR